MVAHFDVFVDDFIEIQFLLGHLSVEIGHFFESHLLDGMVEEGLFKLDLSVLETSLE